LIGRLTGKLLEIDAGMLLLDVAGVGYEVEVSATILQALPTAGDELTLHIHFVVREDAQLLFGFATKAERDLFRAFIKINGVGPKLGLALISSVDLQTLAAAVRSNDSSVLTKVPGVGKKTAERLMVELKNRMEHLSAAGGVDVSSGGGSVSPQSLASELSAEAEYALISLGYRPQEAARAVSLVLESTGDEPTSAEELIRLALRGFAKSA